MNTLILGGGFSGLAAGIATDGTVYEASEHPGGLGHEYKINDYRFSTGGGHWLFGGDPLVTAFIKGLCDIKRYERKSSVYFPDKDQFYPYPIQQHPEFAKNIYDERYDDPRKNPTHLMTMKNCLLMQFGPTACEKFFFPFNDLYTAGLYDKVAAQDTYKTPTLGRGYNETFIYPVKGLDNLARRMAARCRIRFNKKAVRIYPTQKVVEFSDGTAERYERLISTLPLNKTVAMAALSAGKPDPHVSVFVLNIGAERGPKCPDDHWVYVPKSESGFHRVGFYSNVDSGFAPNNKVAVYVEFALSDHRKPATSGASELQKWGWIGKIETVDLTFVDVAYTYRNIGSTWREDSLALLKKHNIHSIGRYGNWKFCGIVQSMREGFEAGQNVLSKARRLF